MGDKQLASEAWNLRCLQSRSSLGLLLLAVEDGDARGIDYWKADARKAVNAEDAAWDTLHALILKG